MTSFETEWTRLKQDAATRSVRRLASADAAAAGGGSGDVKSTKSAWTAAGNGVGGLRAGITEARSALDRGQEGLRTAGGVGSAAAQAVVFRSWDAYLKKVSGRCTALAQQLRTAGSDLHGSDKAVEQDFARLRAAYEDTPAVGGRDSASSGASGSGSGSSRATGCASSSGDGDR
ncbi:hypothetical protein [Streptomyces corynorhini]|uniref:Uncharacterized protein n=1 Tax=Streptomyces corynorhini TaxID=2282652 RepID=A0A370BE77_9ACTN|nr:hypothetical protein [Streptomyces corynorhini]RDG38982.1 hypothetical protein DVH02_06455 [Streptomyces corynorhini]